jgi:hypothetical protein
MTNRLAVMLGNSEIGELVHFQVIGDILHVFRLSQHGAYVFLRIPQKIKTSNTHTHTHTHTPSFSSKLFDLVRFSTKSSSANPQIEKQQQKHARAWFLVQLVLFSYTKSSFTNHRRTHKTKKTL